MRKALKTGGLALSLIAAGLLLGGSGIVDIPEVARAETAGPDAAVSANTAFGMKLFRDLVERDGDRNILISPVGLGTVLAMAYNGAAGETAREMAGALELGDMGPDGVNRSYASLLGGLQTSDDDLRLDIASSLWADRATSFKQDFLATSRASYGATIENLDLSSPGAPGIINAWVADETGGKIGGIIGEIDRDIVLYLINAIYFKGRWAVPFDSAYTAERDFTLANGTTKPVATMMGETENGRYYVGEGFKAACLDYADGRMSMYLLLPDEASGLDALCSRLDPDTWAGWLSDFETGPTAILLPRFSLRYDAVLNDALMALGMRRAFAGADFGRMTQERIFISIVKHSTRLEVGEEGAEGASAALVGFKKGPATRLTFTHPFLFAVVDNATGAILFLGTVTTP